VVAELIQLEQAYLTGTVMAELLHGAKGKREMKELEELEAVFATIPIYSLSISSRERLVHLWMSSADIPSFFID
jgi:predicted nucleic acid-binding protein